MNKDIEFHYGHRNCGKSEIVEKSLASIKTKVYIGTLPQLCYHLDTINKHKIRRGENWITINLNHELDSDLYLLNSVLSNLPLESACMLDGIWTWYYFTDKKKELRPEIFAYNLITIIKKYCRIWKLVDIADYVFEKQDSNFNNIYIIHEIIKMELNITKLIDYQYEKF